MLKAAIIFVFGVVFWQNAYAQKRDSVLLYITTKNKIVNTKDSAYCVLFIMMPPDSSTGVKINTVKEFYLNKQPKLIGNAIININGRQLDMCFNGFCVKYYPNGHKMYESLYKNGIPDGYSRRFYPNGRLYSLSLSLNNKGDKMIECRDSTGNIFAQKGAGKWMDFDPDFKHKIAEGMIKDSLQDGEWQTFVNDSAKYTVVYKRGMAISSTEPGWADRVFAAVELEPHFKGAARAFNNFLTSNIKFPAVDRTNRTQGKVIVTFVVEKDGSLSDIKALRSPSQTMADAVVAAIQQSPKWVPGIQNGRSVRVQYTISFAFSLAGN